MRTAPTLAGLCAAMPAAMLSPGMARGQAAPDPTPTPSSQRTQVSAGMPEGFGDLGLTQRTVVDAYFGGKRIGQFEVESEAGKVRILHPDRLVAAIPDLLDTATVLAALNGPLDPNSRYTCTDPDQPCERPRPDVAAIVHDAARFRLDLYINPRFLKVHADPADRFLKPYSPAPSVVNGIGVALAGGDGVPVSYSVRNRLVASAGATRLMSEASVSSGRGLDVDTAAIQHDRSDLRYSAGLFYVPGPDLVGRRRIVGAGIATQFDTRADRQAMSGNPLVVFLAQRSRVDLYVQGRLVSSRTLDAGNQQLDTAGLPDGSYPVELRIQEAGGASRSEQRFFTKSATLAPPGRVVFYANAGLLALDREHSPLSIARLPLMSAGAAGRVGAHLAWDASTMATDRKVLAEAGVSLLTSFVQTRVAVLGSSAGDRGVIAQIGSTGASAISYNLDLRQVHGRKREPLIPVDDYAVSTFNIADVQAQRLSGASSGYTQLVGNLAYHLGEAQIGGSAYFRRDTGSHATYAFGPTVRWAIFQRNRFQLVFNGNYAETDRGRSVAGGLQLQLLGKRSSFSANVGAQTANDGRRRMLEDVAEVSGSIQREHVLGGQFAASAAFQHSSAGDVVQVAADTRNQAGYAALSVVDRLGGNSADRQYGLTAQTAFGFGHGALRLGAQDQNDAIISVGAHGPAGTTRYEVLVDDMVRGTIASGQHLSFAVTPYRRYQVRLRAVGSELVALDPQGRTVDAYPGTFAPLEWKATPVLAMFGRLLDGAGGPIANADITAGDAIAATDDHGYFQLQAPSNARLTVHRANGATCTAGLHASPSTKGYTPLGDVTCQP